MVLLYEGVLNKRGRVIAGISIWKWRYFELSDGQLEWSDKTRKQARGCVDVSDIVSVTRLAGKRFHRHRFALQFINSPAFECSALTEKDMTQWIDKLNECIQHNAANRHSQRRQWKERCAVKRRGKLSRSKQPSQRSNGQQGRAVHDSSDGDSDIESDAMNSELRDTVEDDGQPFSLRLKHRSMLGHYNSKLTSNLPATNMSLQRRSISQSVTSTQQPVILNGRQLIQPIMLVIGMLVILLGVLSFDSTGHTLTEINVLIGHTLTMTSHHTPLPDFLPMFSKLRTPALLVTAGATLYLEVSRKITLASVLSVIEAALIVSWHTPVK